MSKPDTRVPGGVSLGRWAGIPVTLDWSLLIIFALVLFNLGAGVLPEWHPAWAPWMTWSVAFGAAVLFFLSVLLHELSHALVGRLFGIPVSRITLFLFGGMAHTDEEAPSPKAEFWMAIAGPIASMVIGVGALLLGVGLMSVSMAQLDAPTEVMSHVGPLATLLLWLGPINIVLAVFNMIPGFPLDGGRVLRAAIWAATGDLGKATKWASYSGQGFAALMIAYGLFSAFTSGFSGIWLVLIGWFLWRAARGSYQQLLVMQALEGAKVHDVMRRHLAWVRPEISVASLVSEHFMRSDQRAFPVLGEGGVLVGLVTVTDVQRLPQERRATTTVAEIMTPVSELEQIGEDAPASDALQKLGARDVDQVPVVDGRGTLLGLVRRQDILRWLTLRDPRQPA